MAHRVFYETAGLKPLLRCFNALAVTSFSIWRALSRVILNRSPTCWRVIGSSTNTRWSKMNSSFGFSLFLNSTNLL